MFQETMHVFLFFRELILPFVPCAMAVAATSRNSTTWTLQPIIATGQQRTKNTIDVKAMVLVNVCVFVHVRVFVWLCVSVCASVYVYMCVYVCVCACVCVCVCVCVSQWKKVPDECQARQATPALLEVSSSKHIALKLQLEQETRFISRSLPSLQTKKEKRNSLLNLHTLQSTCFGTSVETGVDSKCVFFLTVILSEQEPPLLDNRLHQRESHDQKIGNKAMPSTYCWTMNDTLSTIWYVLSKERTLKFAQIRPVDQWFQLVEWTGIKPFFQTQAKQRAGGRLDDFESASPLQVTPRDNTFPVQVHIFLGL